MKYIVVIAVSFSITKYIILAYSNATYLLTLVKQLETSQCLSLFHCCSHTCDIITDMPSLKS